MARPRLTRLLERVAIVVAAFALSIGIIALLSGGLLAGRDDPGVSASGGSLGVRYRDLGHAHLAPGSLHPLYDSVPPTSGPHVPLSVKRNESELNVDRLLQALEVGDVVIMYGTKSPPPGLRALADSVASPFTPSLAAAGQAVVLARRPGIRGLTALAWTRMLHVGSASDPNLRAFVQQWLGHGAPGR
jgi:Protein of unknown function (DUF3105)